MGEYRITGTVTFSVNFDVESNSEEEAMEIAESEIRSYHNLFLGTNHICGGKLVKLNIDANGYDDE
jgi:predicted small metal-binding protein